MLHAGVIHLEAAGLADQALCPACGTPGTRVHDRYRRRPLDLPWRGCTVRLDVTVRRFCCDAADCARATFAEDFGAAIPRRSRRSAAATDVLLHVVQAAGGEGGARLARALGLPTSPDTLLRLQRRAGQDPAVAPRVLGVDDLALRRGQRYATLLVDLETRRPLDLLPGRTAEILAEWLRVHPGVEIVVRDRAEAYAEGVRAGAPEAEQVADRFHLVQNASTALEELLRGRRRILERELQDAVAPERAGGQEAATAATASLTPRPPSPTTQHQAARRAARVARWERAHALRAEGQTISAIARELGAGRMTVRRLLATPLPPHNQVRHPRPEPLASPTLAPHLDYLQDRWQQGCRNLSQLCRELVARGYAGSYSLLREATHAWRLPRARAPGPTPKPQRRRLNARWLCLRPPAQLDDRETAALDRLLAANPELALGHQLLQRFRTLVAARTLGALDRWLDDAAASGLPSFRALANGIAADRRAVDRALTTPWSTGPVEGHVHRVKLLKRQGYGRAKLDLLRCRVLAA